MPWKCPACSIPIRRELIAAGDDTPRPAKTRILVVDDEQPFARPVLWEGESYLEKPATLEGLWRLPSRSTATSRRPAATNRTAVAVELGEASLKTANGALEIAGFPQQFFHYAEEVFMLHARDVRQFSGSPSVDLPPISGATTLAGHNPEASKTHAQSPDGRA